MPVTRFTPAPVAEVFLAPIWRRVVVRGAEHAVVPAFTTDDDGLPLQPVAMAKRLTCTDAGLVLPGRDPMARFPWMVYGVFAAATSAGERLDAVIELRIGEKVYYRGPTAIGVPLLGIRWLPDVLLQVTIEPMTVHPISVVAGIHLKYPEFVR